MANKELELYISGSKSTGVLLYGNKGMPLKEEALSLAASLLNTTKEKLSVHPDFLLIEREKDAKYLGVDSLNDLFVKIALKPAFGTFIVILIHNIDFMTEQAQNKLLKTLEDNLSVRIITTANDVDKVLPTIKSRVRQINFYPLTKTDFKNWCENNSYSYSEELYFVTRGCPGIIEEYEEVVTVFKALGNAYEEHSVKNFYQILHLLKEKDSENFFAIFPDVVPNLWDYLGYLVKCSLINQRLYHTIPKYKNEYLEKAILVVSKQMSAYKQPSYQKDTFFLGIVDFVEALTGGTIYEYSYEFDEGWFEQMVKEEFKNV